MRWTIEDTPEHDGVPRRRSAPGCTTPCRPGGWKPPTPGTTPHSRSSKRTAGSTPSRGRAPSGEAPTRRRCGPRSTAGCRARCGCRQVIRSELVALPAAHHLDQPPGRRPGRTHADRPRDPGAEGALPAQDPLGRGDLVPALQRARLGIRPGVAVDPRGARRRRVGRERPEGVDHDRPVRQVRDAAGPHQPRRPQARGAQLLHPGHEVAPAWRSAPSSR